MNSGFYYVRLVFFNKFNLMCEAGKADQGEEKNLK